MEKRWISIPGKKDSGYFLGIGENLWERIIRTEITESEKTTGWVLITDQNVQRIYQQQITEMEAGAKAKSLPFLTLTIPPGENSKRLSKIEELAGSMVRKGVDRNTRLIAFGGGVVGDITGFLASIYMRGVSYVQIPTTLLAQVDSSIGGKTGVNLSEGKNLLGSFYPAERVWIDGSFLRTLARKDWINGYGELLKHGILQDPVIVDEVEQKLGDKTLFDTNSSALEDLSSLILKGINVKKEIVEADEREQGIRKRLNYGHTVGHALEALGGYQHYSHGEAVLRGMVYEGEIALNLGLLSQQDYLRIKSLIDGVLMEGRGVKTLEHDINGLLDYMRRDKKNREGKIAFILPEAIGKVREVLLDADELQKIFADRKF